jgi:hypothetical protein
LVCISLFTVFYALIFIFDLLPMMKKKEWKALFLTLPVFMITYITSILYALNIDIPSLANPIKEVVVTMFKLKT